MEEKITYLTVSALNTYISRKYSNDPYLRDVYIKGEVSNCKFHSNGNLYFSIKDAQSKIDAIKYNGYEYKDLKEGDKVYLKSELSFYTYSGKQNLIVTDLKLDSTGELYKKYIELKNKLGNEGLFDNIHKKSVPIFSKNIAVITASTGAAIQDIKRTILRRYPIANINIYSSLVQGEQAVDDIIKNLKLADEDNNDVIVLARGGGAIEDLWSFNSESVVRAIFSCKTPVVTGVGHETDTTLSDYVADKRASTPTAAAELVTPYTIYDIKNHLENSINVLNKSINFKINNYKSYLDNLKNNYYIKNYSNVYAEKKELINFYKKNLELLLKTTIKNKNNDFLRTKQLLISASPLDRHLTNFTFLVERFESNSPINILKNGYGIVSVSNKRLSSVKDVKKEDLTTIQLYDGIVEAEVINITKEVIE